MAPTKPRTDIENYVENNRDDLYHLLKYGDETLRSLVLATLVKTDANDLEQIQEELEIFWRLEETGQLD